MKNAYDTIFLMYMETVAGTITPADQAALDKMLTESEAYRRIWIQLNAEGAAMHLEAFKDRLNETAALNKLKKQIQAGNQQAGQQTSKISDPPHVKVEPDPLTVINDITYNTPTSDEHTKELKTGVEKDLVDSSVDQVNPIGDGEDHPVDGLKRDRTDGWRRRRTLSGMAKVGLTAAAVVLITVSIRLIWFRDQPAYTDRTEIAAMVNQHKQVIQLQLANGQTVAIRPDLKSDILNIGAAKIALNTDTMSFQSTDTAKNLLIVPDGRIYHLTLSDGTKVTLNAATRLRFPFHFSGATREVYLDGEAYFSVAKNASHPFIVHTPLTSIRVLGTKFNVNTYQKDAVNTCLVEGSVRTQANDGQGHALELQPGKEAYFQQEAGFKVTAFDQEEVLSWIQEVNYFHNLPLPKLAELITRYYGVPVILDNNKLMNRSVTGMMDRKNLPELLSDLSIIAGVNYYYTGKQLHLK